MGLAALAAFCFGTTIVFQRAVARDGIGAPTALGIRFALAGAILAGVLAALRRPLLPPPGERAVVVFLGVLYSAESTFFFLALERGTAAAVALLFYLYPAVVAMVEVALGAIRLRASLVGALVLAIGGGITVAAGGGRVAITHAGVLFIMGSVAVFSTYAVVGDRRLARTDSLTAAAWTAIVAAVGVTLLGLTGAAGQTLRMPSAGALAALAGNAVATAAAFTLFFVVLVRLGPSRTAITMALEAVFGIVLSALFLGESVRPLVAVGGAAILAGAVLAALGGPVGVELRESASPP